MSGSGDPCGIGTIRAHIQGTPGGPIVCPAGPVGWSSGQHTRPTSGLALRITQCTGFIYFWFLVLQESIVGSSTPRLQLIQTVAAVCAHMMAKHRVPFPNTHTEFPCGKPKVGGLNFFKPTSEQKRTRRLTAPPLQGVNIAAVLTCLLDGKCAC